MKRPTIRLPRLRRPAVARGRRLAALEVSGFVAIVAGVAMIYPPAAVILAGAIAVAAAFALERSEQADE